MFRRLLFSIFFPIYRFCHPVLPSFKQYTCSAGPFFNLFSYIQVLFCIQNCHHVLSSLTWYTCFRLFLYFSILVLPLCLTVPPLGLNNVRLFLVTVPLQVFIQIPYPKVFFRPSNSHNQHKTRMKYVFISNNNPKNKN